MSKLLEQINTESKTYKVSDLADIKYGFGLPEPKRIKGSIPVYASSGLVGFHNESKVDKPAIIIGRKGNVGSLYFAKTSSYPIDTAFFIDEPKEGFDLKYIFYLLKRINLPRYGGDSAVPGLSRDTIYSLSIKAPNILTQKKIAEILSAYDAKIENNNSIIRNLELMAQTIFDEWFLELHFPGHENESFPENRTEEIPKGWKIGKFTDHISVLGGGTPSTTIQKYWNGEIPFFTPKDVGDGFYSLKTEKNLTSDGLENCNSKLYPPDTVFITARGTVGKIALSGTSMAMNQSCYALQGKNNLSSFFVLLLTRNLIKELQQVAIGGVFDTITTSTFEHTEILMPEESLIKKFNGVIKPIFDKILSMNIENQFLNNSRDQLLAKLI